MSEVRWLLVGAGDIARKRVAPALQAAADSRLEAICDVNETGARALAVECGVPEVYHDLDLALERSPVDAVYIATPVWLHVQQMTTALSAGKHVLVEKPLGLNAPDCRRAIAVARSSGKTAGCAYFRRLSPRFLQARRALERGELGSVVHVRMVYYSWFAPASDDPKRWRVLREKSGGGPISDMGSHMFDVLIGLFGMPATVSARCDNLVHAWDVEDAASILMAYKGGPHVSAFLSWSSKTWRHELEIVGTEARLSWLPYDSGPVLKTTGRDTVSLDMPDPGNVHLPLVQDFVEAVLHRRAPACPLQEAYKTNLLIDALYRSSQERREIPLEEAQ